MLPSGFSVIIIRLQLAVAVCPEDMIYYEHLVRYFRA